MTSHANIKLPNSPQRAAEEMIIIINDLQAIYERETEALEQTDTVTFNALQDQKMSAARKYEQGIAQMVKRRAEMGTVTEATKQTLRDMQENFAALAHKNKNLLERMQRTTQRLGETIRSAAKDAVQKRSSIGYSASGQAQSVSNRNMSVGINETA